MALEMGHSENARGEDLLVEVLFDVRGLKAKDLQQVISIPLKGNSYRTLSPITLLKAKLNNACELQQETATGKRNDIKHVRMLVLYRLLPGQGSPPKTSQDLYVILLGAHRPTRQGDVSMDRLPDHQSFCGRQIARIVFV